MTSDLSEKHVSVLVHEVVEALSPRDGGIYVDGTFGYGGYSRRVLEAADCSVYGIDRDPVAIARGRELEGQYGGRLKVLEGRFGEMVGLLSAQGIDRVDGVALDLGVSSMQLDEAERGFSFMNDGPLDMRMGATGQSAADVVNNEEEADLADIIYTYGEDRKSRKIARRIVEARTEAPITRTLELARIVEKALGGRPPTGIHPATRTFQALRIYVNEELRQLEDGLRAAETVLKPGGRLAVVSFHSLEDRIVKRFLAAKSGKRSNPSRHAPALDTVFDAPTFTLLGKAIKAQKQETSVNPRSRSATLRVAERTDAAVVVQGEAS